MSAASRSSDAGAEAGSSSSSGEAVKVIVRCRPLNSKEKAEGDVGIVNVDSSSGVITLARPANMSGKERAESNTKSFRFDAVYGTDSTTRTIYDEIVASLTDSTLDGYNACVFGK